MEKLKAEFYKHRLGKDGLSSWCKTCVSAYSSTYDAAHKDIKIARAKERWAQKIQGRDELAQKQSYLCAICKQPEMARHKNGRVLSLAMDHDHVTNQRRGLLCGKCNRMLGLAGDSIDTLQEAIKYLQQWKKM